jgi:hypothetical protein
MVEEYGVHRRLPVVKFHHIHLHSVASDLQSHIVSPLPPPPPYDRGWHQFTSSEAMNGEYMLRTFICLSQDRRLRFVAMPRTVLQAKFHCVTRIYNTDHVCNQDVGRK